MEKLTFGFESDLDDADGNTIAEDAAPNGPPYYTYSFAPLTLAMANPAGAPKKPVAGKAFVVSAVADPERRRGSGVRSGHVPGKGRQAVASRDGEPRRRDARCAMRIPKGAKRKVLRGSITAQVDEATVTKSFKFTVR